MADAASIWDGLQAARHMVRERAVLQLEKRLKGTGDSGVPRLWFRAAALHFDLTTG